MAQSPRAGIRALLESALSDPLKLTASRLGFSIVPRINACGRLSSADAAVEMLLSDDETEAEKSQSNSMMTTSSAAVLKGDNPAGCGNFALKLRNVLQKYNCSRSSGVEHRSDRNSCLTDSGNLRKTCDSDEH